MLATASAIKVAGGTPIPVDIGEDYLINGLTRPTFKIYNTSTGNILFAASLNNRIIKFRI